MENNEPYVEPLMSRDHLAHLFSVSPGTITDWVRKEGMPVAKPGAGRVQAQYRPSACVTWRFNELQRRYGGGEGISPAAARARKDTADAEIAERKLEIMRRDYVLKSEVERLLGPRVAATKTRIEALPRSVAPECARAGERGGARAIEQVLHTAVRALLTDLATMEQPL
jgi:hypothetical protein